MFARTSVTEEVARRLQEMIQSGELQPDERIPSQRVLAERLRVSRTSLREALLTLETLGLVRTYPARGTFVIGRERRPAEPLERWRYGRDHTMAEVFETRLALEPAICRLAALVITAEALGTLDAATEDFAEAWARRDLVAHAEADLAFHRLIAEACPNRMLQSLHHGVQALLAESQRQPIPHTEAARMRASIDEHHTILDALRARDAGRAQEAMWQHITNTARCTGIELR